ncbi:MAG: hypothetical protein WCI51_01010 [Lentisphaerota bacterium]
MSAESDKNKLRLALIGLVGEEDPQKLEELKATMQAMPGISEDDRRNTITAITALIETVPGSEGVVHYAPNNRVACSRWSFAVNKTSRPKEVTCKKCLKSNYYRTNLTT